jgi:hypothetical protein
MPARLPGLRSRLSSGVALRPLLLAIFLNFLPRGFFAFLRIFTYCRDKTRGEAEPTTTSLGWSPGQGTIVHEVQEGSETLLCNSPCCAGTGGWS